MMLGNDEISDFRVEILSRKVLALLNSPDVSSLEALGDYVRLYRDEMTDGEVKESVKFAIEAMGRNL